LASRENLSRWSKLRQYWIIVMVRPAHIVRAPSMPFSGCFISVAIIFGMARKTGSHWCTFHSLLKRMPMTKTTNSPSIVAV